MILQKKLLNYENTGRKKEAVKNIRKSEIGAVLKVMSVALIELVEMTATLNVVVSINSTTVMQTYWTAPVFVVNLKTYFFQIAHTVRKKIMENEDESTEVCSCCSGKHKERDEKEFKDLMNRLKRIEGQVRGVQNMLENNVYCTDILIQVSAINSALNSFNKVLLGNHLKTCVAENIRNGNNEIIDELMNTLQKLMK